MVFPHSNSRTFQKTYTHDDIRDSCQGSRIFKKVKREQSKGTEQAGLSFSEFLDLSPVLTCS